VTTNQEIAQEAVEEYLASSEYSVIALKGPWGTGKTHIWNNIQAKLEKNDTDPSPAYCSLFGVASIEAVKKQLFEYVMESRNPVMAKGMKAASTLMDSVGKMAEKFVPGAGAATGVAHGAVNLVANSIVSTALSGRVVVLDDFERRDEKLSVSAVLGLVDYLKGRKCKVMLIFNEEKLTSTDSSNALVTFREKSLDIEVSVSITPSEAFDIAATNRNPPYAEDFRKCFEKSRITNIRVALRILNLLEKIFSGNRTLDPRLVDSSLPAAVILTALYYHGIEGAPDFDDVISVARGFGLVNVDALTERHQVARQFINENLEKHLRTGHSLKAEFFAYIEATKLRLSEIENRARLIGWLEDARWNSHTDANQLSTEAQFLVFHANLLSFPEASMFYDELARMGEIALADQYVAAAVKKLDESGTESDVTVATLNAIENRTLPAPIGSAISRLRDRLNPIPSLTEAVRRAAKKEILRENDRLILKLATASEFCQVLEAAQTGDLREFIKFYGAAIRGSVGSELIALDTTITSCLNLILNTVPENRLAEIIRRSLDSIGLEETPTGMPGKNRVTTTATNRQDGDESGVAHEV
jgi:KAP family P-loop domain